MTKKPDSFIELVFNQVSREQRNASKQSKRVTKSIMKHKENMEEQKKGFRLIRNK